MAHEEIKRVTLGQKVENFKLETFDPTEGGFGKLNLEQNMKDGKWTVLMFYPADYTFVCPTELADAAAKYDQFRELGAVFASVSTDTQFCHMAWQRDERLLKQVKYPMAADPTGRVSKQFGVYDYNTGLALRGTFIINPEGELVGQEVNFYPVGRNADELLRKLKAYVHVRNHPTEACPAKWDEGQKTLKPGANLVGKVADALE